MTTPLDWLIVGGGVHGAQMSLMKGDEAGATEALVRALELKPDHMPAMDALAKLGWLAKIYENPRDAASLPRTMTCGASCGLSWRSSTGTKR